MMVTKKKEKKKEKKRKKNLRLTYSLSISTRTIVPWLLTASAEESHLFFKLKSSQEDLVASAKEDYS